MPFDNLHTVKSINIELKEIISINNQLMGQAEDNIPSKSLFELPGIDFCAPLKNRSML